MEQHRQAALTCCFPLFLLLERHKWAEETRLRAIFKRQTFVYAKGTLFWYLNYLFHNKAMSFKIWAHRWQHLLCNVMLSDVLQQHPEKLLSKTWNIDFLNSVAFVCPETQYAILTIRNILVVGPPNYPHSPSTHISHSTPSHVNV